MRADWGESERTRFPSLDSPVLFFFFVHTLPPEHLEQALGGGGGTPSHGLYRQASGI